MSRFPNSSKVVAIVSFVIVAGIGHAQTAAPNDRKAVQFETEVSPIFKSSCDSCHGGSVKLKNLDLSTETSAVKGSESGPVIVPGKPDESLLYQKVRSGSMPAGKPHLSDKQLATIKSWIEDMAPSTAKLSDTVDNTPITQNDVIPIMLVRCTVCHGGRRQEGGLDLRSKAAMLKGGKSGPAIVIGKPEESLVVKKIEAGEMPPKQKLIVVGVKPVTPGETHKIAKWIAQGAPEIASAPTFAGTEKDPLVHQKDRLFWAFQTPHRPEPPKVHHTDRVRNAIDAFLLAKLEAKHLSFSPEADRSTLIRRATFDLTGMPPEPAEVKAFLADKDPQAYEKLIDKLLASPRYGERWGRYWLDLAGYADSEGGKLSADLARPYAFRYRDYVIRAFNSDKPYNRFLTEQIAGDELMDYEKAPVITQEIMDNLIATGFLRMAPDSTTEREVNFVDDRIDVIADEIETVTSSVMGLTLKCARCHDHKYDPLPQRDYYRFKAIFQGAYDEHDWVAPLTLEKYGLYFPGRYLPYVTPGATPVQLLEEQRYRELVNKELAIQIKETKAALEKKAEELKKIIIEQRLQTQPKDLQEDLRALAATPPAKRDEVQKYLAQKFATVLKVENAELKKDPAYAKEAKDAEKKIKLLEYQMLPEPKIRALWDRGTPSPAYILRRGNPTSFGPEVDAGPPAVLTTAALPYNVRQPWQGSSKTGRRLAFAEWMTNPDHPLTSRVMVNRIWKNHFGTGIVKSLGNFGKTGAPPTNPELLDWLATEFVKQGWSMKQMHRMMMTSSAYRQVSTVGTDVRRIDPDNLLLSRMPMRRMDAENLNDTMLLVSGRLDESRFGVPAPVEVRDDGLVTQIETPKGFRRSIYVQQRRTEIPTVLDNFDLPPMSPNCSERTESTVSLQALYLLNNGLVHQLAESTAARIKAEAGDNVPKQIDTLYWRALSREPSAEERKLALEAISKIRQATLHSPLKDSASESDAQTAALTQLCHTIFNSAAFLYID
jgi:mono/diheme cytochrome c family protein